MASVTALKQYDNALNKMIRRIESCDACMKVNSRYYLDYYDFLLAEVLVQSRIVKDMWLAIRIDNVLCKDLKRLNQKDVIKYLGWIEKSYYSEWTKCDYRTGMKKFVRWLNNGKDPILS